MHIGSILSAAGSEKQSSTLHFPFSCPISESAEYHRLPPLLPSASKLGRWTDIEELALNQLGGRWVALSVSRPQSTPSWKRERGEDVDERDSRGDENQDEGGVVGGHEGRMGAGMRREAMHPSASPISNAIKRTAPVYHDAMPFPVPGSHLGTSPHTQARAIDDPASFRSAPPTHPAHVFSAHIPSTSQRSLLSFCSSPPFAFYPPRPPTPLLLLLLLLIRITARDARDKTHAPRLCQIYEKYAGMAKAARGRWSGPDDDDVRAARMRGGGRGVEWVEWGARPDDEVQEGGDEDENERVSGARDWGEKRGVRSGRERGGREGVMGIRVGVNGQRETVGGGEREFPSPSRSSRSTNRKHNCAQGVERWALRDGHNPGIEKRRKRKRPERGARKCCRGNFEGYAAGDIDELACVDDSVEPDAPDLPACKRTLFLQQPTHSTFDAAKHLAKGWTKAPRDISVDMD
ncbi:hypothetical protein R3P38DRAFT_2814714 [Favolaschia claudopus]|uniref:Uncharacterized protein n=1 Tax=Favolaschia claudopus TaxID=2862362 RepID=A0AAV9Z2G2_9AGAR